MQIAVFSDIHDNLARWGQATEIIKKNKIEVGICCGDVTSPETLSHISRGFKRLFLCFGNADCQLAKQKEQIPENVTWFEETGEFVLSKKKFAIVHFDKIAQKLAGLRKYDFVIYGHTHTPWEKKVGETLMLNPGEIAGQFGQPTFAITDLAKMKTSLIILK